MKSVYDILPLLLILLFLPLAIYGRKWEEKLPGWVSSLVFAGIGLFFLISAVIQPDLRYNNLLFAFFAFLLLYRSYKMTKVDKASGT